MAREEQQVPRLGVLRIDGPDGEALLDPGVTVDDDAVEEIGHGHQPGAVDAHGALAAPAVGGPPVQQGGLRQAAAERPFLLRAGGGVVGLQNAVLDKAGLAVRQADGPPALLRLPGGGHHRAPGQGDQGIPLDLRGGEDVTEVLVPHRQLGQSRPGGGLLVSRDQIGLPDNALIAVVGADPPPAGGGALQQLRHHAVQGLIHHRRVVPAHRAGPVQQRADGDVHNGFHGCSLLSGKSGTPPWTGGR